MFAYDDIYVGQYHAKNASSAIPVLLAAYSFCNWLGKVVRQPSINASPLSLELV